MRDGAGAQEECRLDLDGESDLLPGAKRRALVLLGQNQGAAAAAFPAGVHHRRVSNRDSDRQHVEAALS
jgi:hypothetical protein